MISDIFLSLLSLKTAPGDYTMVNSTNVTFDPNHLSHVMNVTVVDDVIHEGMQQFFGSLSTTDRAVILQPERGNVNITDNDRKNVECMGVHVCVHECVFVCVRVHVRMCVFMHVLMRVHVCV